MEITDEIINNIFVNSILNANYIEPKYRLLYETIKVFLQANDPFAISLIQRKRDLDHISDIIGSNYLINLVRNAISWYNKPIRITTVDMSFKKGRIAVPGYISFRFFDDLEDDIYPVCQKINYNLYFEIVDTLSKFGLKYQDGSNKLSATYKIGKRYDVYHQNDWLKLKVLFIDVIVNLGYLVRLEEK